MTTDTAHAQKATLHAIHDHHDRLARTMADHTLTIERAVDQLNAPADRQARLVAFCTEEVLPHAVAEERTLYQAGADLPQTRLLVRAMTREHVLLRALVGTLEAARTSGAIVAASGALNAMFQAHLEKENDLLLPALVDAGVDLGALLTGMHDILGGHGEAGHGETGHGGHEGNGGPVHGDEPELDVRVLAPAQRHAQIFEKFEALAPGTAFTLVNDHDPKPLYYQFAAEHTGRFSWDYLESGPEVWRVRIGRP